MLLTFKENIWNRRQQGFCSVWHSIIPAYEYGSWKSLLIGPMWQDYVQFQTQKLSKMKSLIESQALLELFTNTPCKSVYHHALCCIVYYIRILYTVYTPSSFTVKVLPIFYSRFPTLFTKLWPEIDLHGPWNPKSIIA